MREETSTMMWRFCSVSVPTCEDSQRGTVVESTGRLDGRWNSPVPKIRLDTPVAAIAMTEPTTGSDLQRVRTRAVRAAAHGRGGQRDHDGDGAGQLQQQRHDDPRLVISSADGSAYQAFVAVLAAGLVARMGVLGRRAAAAAAAPPGPAPVPAAVTPEGRA